MLNVGRRVFFSEGSAALDSTARATIRNQVQWLKATRNGRRRSRALPMTPGSDAQQTALSQKRADAVKNDMVAQGIPASRIWAKGYGRDRLVGDCAELECKAQNRRTVPICRTGRRHNSVRPVLSTLATTGACARHRASRPAWPNALQASSWGEARLTLPGPCEDRWLGRDQLAVRQGMLRRLRSFPYLRPVDRAHREYLARRCMVQSEAVIPPSTRRMVRPAEPQSFFMASRRSWSGSRRPRARPGPAQPASFPGQTEDGPAGFSVPIWGAETDEGGTR